jgi:hypothetical protein
MRWRRRRWRMMFLNLTLSSKGVFRFPTAVATGVPPPNGGNYGGSAPQRRELRGFRPPTAGTTLEFDLRCNPRSAAVRLDRRSAKSEYRRRSSIHIHPHPSTSNHIHPHPSIHIHPQHHPHTSAVYIHSLRFAGQVLRLPTSDFYTVGKNRA